METNIFVHRGVQTMHSATMRRKTGMLINVLVQWFCMTNNKKNNPKCIPQNSAIVMMRIKCSMVPMTRPCVCVYYCDLWPVYTERLKPTTELRWSHKCVRPLLKPVFFDWTDHIRTRGELESAHPQIKFSCSCWWSWHFCTGIVRHIISIKCFFVFFKANADFNMWQKPN